MMIDFTKRNLTVCVFTILVFTTALASNIENSFAQSNPNLFVSAENQFNNRMSGSQVIEVVIRDKNIGDTNKGLGEPDVTVNGKDLRMIQATDGNWYAYFADRKQAMIADSTVKLAGKGLDFGTFCSRSSNVLGFSVTDSDGIAIPVHGTGVGGQNGTKAPTQITETCSFSDPKSKGTINVVREPKASNPFPSASKRGQIGLVSADLWPFIQLYDFNPTGNIVVQYNRGGGPQSVTLSFDTAEKFVKTGLDREKYPRSSDVHLSITDLNLNIDPTDEDSWTFGTNPSSPSTFYQLFNENGQPDADGTSGASNIISDLGLMMFKQNGILKINPKSQGENNAVTINDNDDSRTNGNGVTSINLISTDGNSLSLGTQPITITETLPNSSVFSTSDENNESVLVTTSDAARGTSATIEYNKQSKSLVIGFGTGTLMLDERFKGKEWNSGEKLPVILIDSDANKNTKSKEDLDLFKPEVSSIPSLSTGDPFTLGESGTGANTKLSASFVNGFTLTPSGTTGKFTLDSTTLATKTTTSIDRFSDRAKIVPSVASDADALVIDLKVTMDELRNSIHNPFDSNSNFKGLNMFNYDFRSIGPSTFKIYLLANTAGIINDADGTINSGANAILIDEVSLPQNLISLNSTRAITPSALHSLLFGSDIAKNNNIGLMVTFAKTGIDTKAKPIVADFFSFGIIDDGIKSNERIANQIVRLELEEVQKSSDTFRGSLEYIMLNQINILDPLTYEKIVVIDDEVSFIAIDDLKDKDSPRVNYIDLRQDGSTSTISDQQPITTHRGIVSLDSKAFKAGDVVTVSVYDKDLNTDSDLVDIYTVVSPTKFPSDPAVDSVGKEGLGRFSNGNPFGTLLEITFDDERWVKSSVTFNGKSCSGSISGADGLFSTGFTLMETDRTSGLFTGTFKMPDKYCSRNQGGKIVSTSGVDIEGKYYDFRDDSGEVIGTATSSAVSATSGFPKLGSAVYPVPFGGVDDFFDGKKSTSVTPERRSVFPVHHTAITRNGDLNAIDANSEEIGPLDLTIHIRIDDADFNTSPKGEDKISQNLPASKHGPVKVMIKRGSNTVVLATAGSDSPKTGVITTGSGVKEGVTRELGPITEVAPDTGVFKFSLPIRYTDGPVSTECPITPNEKFTPLDKSKSGITSRFDSAPTNGNYCILRGDVLVVEYTDLADSSGSRRVTTDNAVFDMRPGVLQSDKQVFVIGNDMILTLVEPDLDLDIEKAETYSLDLIQWKSSAGTTTLGKLGGPDTKNGQIFDPEPFGLRETGKDSGIFQTLIEIPEAIGNKKLDRGEKITLEYTDWGPPGAKFVGFDDEDYKHVVYTSNFGALIELDKKVYTWTDRVFIKISSADHNFDSNKIDEIGKTDKDEIKISTRANKLSKYRLTETGPDTGIFTGEVILTGFKHDADGDPRTGDERGIDTTPKTEPKTGGGPNNGFLESRNDDGLTVSFKHTERQTSLASALIKWNIAEVKWHKSTNLRDGKGIIEVIEPDLNLNPKAVDNFSVDVWSDSDIGGVDIKVVETGKDTGIFEGSVFFTTNNPSSGNRLRVSEGDTVTAKYEDNTLPKPFSTKDELKITARTFIGQYVPFLERISHNNPRIIDSSGNASDVVSLDRQVLIKSDLINMRNKNQDFAFIIVIDDSNGITRSISWLSGSMTPHQQFSPSLLWVPQEKGSYGIAIYTWESVSNPTALSPVQFIDVTVE